MVQEQSDSNATTQIAGPGNPATNLRKMGNVKANMFNDNDLSFVPSTEQNSASAKYHVSFDYQDLGPTTQYPGP